MYITQRQLAPLAVVAGLALAGPATGMATAKTSIRVLRDDAATAARLAPARFAPARLAPARFAPARLAMSETRLRTSVRVATPSFRVDTHIV